MVMQVGIVEFPRLGQCFTDWATAVVDEGDKCETCHISGPIYETSAHSTEFVGMVVTTLGNTNFEKCHTAPKLSLLGGLKSFFWS